MKKSMLLGILILATQTSAQAYEGKCGEAAKSAVQSIVKKNGSRSETKEKATKAKLYYKDPASISDIYIVETQLTVDGETRSAEWKLLIDAQDCQITSIESMGLKH